MVQENQQQPANQAGPGSAPPETQQGLQENKQSGEEIRAGAETDDQLQRFKATAKEITDSNEPDNKDPEEGKTGEPTLGIW